MLTRIGGLAAPTAVMIGLISLGIGAALRSTPGGIAASLGLLLVAPTILAVIPAAWARACLDAVDALGLVPTGDRWAAFDVADEGLDKNALIGGTGVEIDVIQDWSGKGGDIYKSVEHAFELCDEHGFSTLRYDADGLGAGVRGDAAKINEGRIATKGKSITVVPFRGSGEVFDPEGQVFESKRAGDALARTNKDYFYNLKAQGWWSLRRRAYNTWRWRVEKIACHPDEILSINTKKCGPGAMRLVAEMSQPTYGQSATTGKMVINKMPPLMKSPNLGDAAMMRTAPIAAPPLIVTQDVLSKIMGAGLPRSRGRR